MLADVAAASARFDHKIRDIGRSAIEGRARSVAVFVTLEPRSDLAMSSDPPIRLASVSKRFPVAGMLCERVAVITDGRIVDDIRSRSPSASMETAIARAIRGAADDADTSTKANPTDRAGAERRPARRVGGLPMPGKTAALALGEFGFVRSDARFAADGARWNCRFPPSNDALRESGSGALALPTRRVGGLPMPGKFARSSRASPSHRVAGVRSDVALRADFDGATEPREAAPV